MILFLFLAISCKFPQLRQNCIKILSTLLCYSSYYGELKCRDAEITLKFSDINLKLKNILLEALKTEEDAINRMSLMWICVVFIIENCSFNVEIIKDFVHQFVLLVLTKVSKKKIFIFFFNLFFFFKDCGEKLDCRGKFDGPWGFVRNFTDISLNPTIF